MNRRLLLLIAATVVVLVGTGLVYLYVQGADERATAQTDTVTVLTTNQPIEVGESFDAAAQAGKIQETPVPQSAVLPNTVSSIADLSGQVAITPIFAGEQIVREKFGAAEAATDLDIPAGQIAISVQLSDTARVAGFVNPGSEVAVFVNGTLETTDTEGTLVGEEEATTLLLERVKVIGVGSSVGATVPATTEGDAASQPAEALPTTLLTLAVPQSEAQKLIYATTNNSIVFALRTPDSKLSLGQLTTKRNLIG